MLMGLFFTKKKPEPRKGPSRHTPVKKQDAKILNRLGCQACPLNKADISSPKMAPTLASYTDVYFLAEAPGKHEDQSSGKPLTGPSGQLLRSCIPDGFEETCSFDNVCNCRPPENRTPTWNEIECCRPRRELFIPKAKPKLIVGLGLVPLQAMLGSSDMVGMRGRVFAVNVGGHHCWFLPTYHPSFILRRAQNKRKPLNSFFGFCLRMDIKRAFDLIADLPPAKVDTAAEASAGIQAFDGSGADDYRAVLTLLSEARKAPEKAIDLETQGLRPYGKDAKVLTCAISFRNTHFSFALQHPKSRWAPEQLDKINQQLFYLVADDTIKIAHNVPFECEWLIWYFNNKSMVNHLAWECTQMQAHFIDERKGKQHKRDDEDRRAAYQALGFLCKQYFGINIKTLFKLNKKNMEKEDIKTILTYNGIDTKYELRLFYWQRQILRNRGLFEAYREALPRQPTVALMQYIGIGVDQQEVKFCQGLLGEDIAEITAKINDLKVIKAFIARKGSFNPDSGPEVVEVFRDYLQRPEIHTEDGKISVDKNVLDQIDHPLAQLLIDYRNRAKLRSTYVDCFELGKGEFVWPDGRIHTSFNTTFTETGRTSSDTPNCQNFPNRHDSWVRCQVVAPKGHVILAFDYGQLEGCTGAMCSKDEVMIKALWEDYDFHMEWARKLAARYPAMMNGKQVDKGFRSLIKNKLVFPAIFGAKNESIAGYLNIPVEPIDDLMDEFWDTFHGLHKWQDKLMKGYYQDGYVESPTGRRHHYPLTRNQAINFPIQCLACDIVCESMNALSYMAAEQGKWHLHPVLNIHDDITAVVPDNNEILEETIKTYCKIMLHPPYDFINVPMSVECSVGKNWFEMKEIGKFWSHKKDYE
jgi:uracil-DNA glycosylase family 4